MVDVSLAPPSQLRKTLQSAKFSASSPYASKIVFLSEFVTILDFVI